MIQSYITRRVRVDGVLQEAMGGHADIGQIVTVAKQLRDTSARLLKAAEAGNKKLVMHHLADAVSAIVNGATSMGYSISAKALMQAAQSMRKGGTGF